MKKCIIIFLSLILILTSCKNVPNNKNVEVSKETGNKNTSSESIDSKPIGLCNQEISLQTSSVGYEIKKLTYKDKVTNGDYGEVEINYSQISSLNDGNGKEDIQREKKINKLLKDTAFKALTENGNKINGFTLDIDYNITWFSENILSIQFIGNDYFEGGNHPNNIINTININIKNGSEIYFKDIINVNNNFIKNFKAGNYKQFNNGLDAGKDAKEELSRFSDNELINMYFSSKNSNFYFTDNSIGISIEVAHAIGDHAEFEIKYKDILDNIKFDNEIWNDFNLK